MTRSFPYRGFLFIIMAGFIFFWSVPCVEAQQDIDPDSLLIGTNLKNFNPFNSLYLMNSWEPVLDHEGKPHKDAHLIQIIVDGGNGIQDTPNSDGTPGGDDTLASGNFYGQFVNGEKRVPSGLSPGMFMGPRYFIPHKPNTAIYLRLWEGQDPAIADYYQDSANYTTHRGNVGGPIIGLQSDYIDQIDWRFGPSKKVERNQ
ncbi:hypothetical protein KKG05_04140 [bacterium]|nr:hypothetical protein [bacterium]